VATVSRIDKIIGFFCRILSLLQGSFAKETCIFIDPTNHSQPISSSVSTVQLVHRYEVLYLEYNSFIDMKFCICSTTRSSISHVLHLYPELFDHITSLSSLSNSWSTSPLLHLHQTLSFISSFPSKSHVLHLSHTFFIYITRSSSI